MSRGGQNKNTIERIYALFDLHSLEGCWPWPRSKTHNGYGQVGFDGKVRLVHKVLYEDIFGPVPNGLQLDHLCRRRSCGNPFHLEAVTLQENVTRGEAGINMRIKTHCPYGHEYSTQNLINTSSGFRRCKVCHRDRERIRQPIRNKEKCRGIRS
jgi:hypothetical protein